MRPRRVLAMMLGIGCIALGARSSGIASPPVSVVEPDDGYVWLTVGDPGNIGFEGARADRGHTIRSRQFAGRGNVPYIYRVSQTEVLVRQYLEFVEVYWPFFDGDPRSWLLTGDYIWGRWDGQGYEYEMTRGWEEAPANMSLRMAARLCNWMHNGKVNEEWAFESGVYDASTFTQNPDGTYNDNYTRSPEARYWIPSLDEWIKAVYYDPNHFGAGEGGWWQQPNASDECLIVALPSEGGETNGSLNEGPEEPLLPAGMYPDVRSPWGLLDVSGGMCEHTEDGYALGSTFYDSVPMAVCSGDRAGTYHHSTRRSPDSPSLTGLRLVKPAWSINNYKEANSR